MESWQRKAVVFGMGMAAGLWLLRRRAYDFTDRVCVIAGGSRGLGLVIARQLARQGAHIVLLARDRERLDRAVEQLEHPHRHLSIACDVTNRNDVDLAVSEILSQMGAIDVLFNVAGVVQVGPFEHMTIDDFHEAMDVHTYGPLHTILAVVPHMRRQGGGRIVNISSIGGKVSFPHMLPYVTSKHALVGLSEGLRHELRKDGIIVTTVCPGLMRTGSPPNALFKGRYRKEYAWFAISDSLPLVSKNAERAAAQIIDACRYGKSNLTITVQAKLAAIMVELFPGVAARALSAVNRFVLPAPDPHANGARHPGHESQSFLAPSFLTQLTMRAAHKNNE